MIKFCGDFHTEDFTNYCSNYPELFSNTDIRDTFVEIRACIREVTLLALPPHPALFAQFLSASFLHVLQISE